MNNNKLSMEKRKSVALFQQVEAGLSPFVSFERQKGFPFKQRGHWWFKGEKRGFWGKIKREKKKLMED